MFDIEFTGDRLERQEEGWYGLWGSTTLGDYRESFLAPFGAWERADYERHWIQAAERLLQGYDRTAFFTAAGQFWWTMWREGETVYVHEEFITPERAEGIADFREVPYHLIEDRVTVSEDGEPISEWRLSVADIREFVQHRAHQYAQP